MNVIESVRAADPAADLPPSGAAARDELLARIVATPVRPRRRARRVAVPALAGVAAAAALLAVVLSGPSGTGEAQARAALLSSAAVDGVGGLVPPRPPRAGEYLYTRTVSEQFTTMDDDDGDALFASVPQTRERWLRSDGSGWEIWRSGAPRFATERDRSRWIEAGRPKLGIDGSHALAAGGDDGQPSEPFTLPDDPDAIYAQITDGGRAEPDAAFMRLYERLLLSGYLTPAQHAALYAAALRLPGVAVDQRVSDAAGRTGTGVTFDFTAADYRERRMLIFDPRTGALLAEQSSTLDDNVMGYPAGTPKGMVTYARTAVVDGVKVRPRAARSE